MPDRINYLLLQVRNPDDPMREHELNAFGRALGAVNGRIRVFDLLNRPLARGDIDRTDMFLIGGSGHYSATATGPWIERALDSLRAVHDSAKPTFASCWGFQAMARALGGRVVHDPLRAELGTHLLSVTEAGASDPLFGPLAPSFAGQMGHEDCVDELPSGTTLLASSDKTNHQAYRFDDRPIYCTQFHPELSRRDMLQRVKHYPHYVEKIAGVPIGRFAELLSETPEAESLLKRFVALVFQ